jgi:hypothetical protein
VDDGVEAAGPEGQPAGGRHHHGRAGAKALGGGAVGGPPQSFQGQVGEDDPAAGGGRQVQAGPAPPGADVEQSARVSAWAMVV